VSRRPLGILSSSTLLRAVARPAGLVAGAAAGVLFKHRPAPISHRQAPDTAATAPQTAPPEASPAAEPPLEPFLNDAGGGEPAPF
jgi:hypothetical protein